MIRERLNTYNKAHCWQYDIRVQNLEQDLAEAGLTFDSITALRVSDFSFKRVTDKAQRGTLKKFIERHEWLGTLSQYTTHWFACYYKETILAGVILFNLPNTFSKLLGEDTPKLERLISRGACVSWSPKNLASSFLMWSIRQVARTSSFRLFTAYSDPTAKELGTIYQACNFYYLGQKAGTLLQYVNPYTGKITSDRYFRQKTAYRKFAKELGITWQPNWSHATGMSWNNVPPNIVTLLRAYSKQKQANSEKVAVMPKHKYAYLEGLNKKETVELRVLFCSLNKTYPYPKERGK